MASIKVSAPCGTCGHKNICPHMDKLYDLKINIDEPISIIEGASVKCREYMAVGPLFNGGTIRNTNL